MKSIPIPQELLELGVTAAMVNADTEQEALASCHGAARAIVGADLISVVNQIAATKS